jgi:Transcriptional Coactivator p15 (PC4)
MQMPITDATTAANAPRDNRLRPTLAEPIPIAKFFKSARDRTKHVRVELSEYEGHPLINVRVWQTGSDGIDRPTVQGIALAIRKLPELSAALVKAHKVARERGLLPPDDGGAA